MDKYEYKKVTAPEIPDRYKNSFWPVNWLNDMGQEGWILVESGLDPTTNTPVMLLLRKKSVIEIPKTGTYQVPMADFSGKIHGLDKD